MMRKIEELFANNEAWSASVKEKILNSLKNYQKLKDLDFYG